MTERLKTSKGNRIEVEAVNPDDWKKPQLVCVRDSDLQFHARRGLGAIEECKYVFQVLSKPQALFRGIRKDEDEEFTDSPGWLCYSTRVSCRYDRKGQSYPSIGEVFLVFVNVDKVVYNWTWYEADPNDDKIPVDSVPRFKERLI